MQAEYGAPQSGSSWVPTRSEHAEGNTVDLVVARERDLAGSKTSCRHGHTVGGTRETLHLAW
jgi:hypothetical protein